ncbi:MAG: transposase family protein, partial [Streptosporangiaceae bacterium]
GAIRALMAARRSAAGERTRTNGQARALILTGPDDLRARFTRHTPAALITGLASLRPRPGDVAGHAVRVALRELGRRAQFPDSQLERLDELIVPLVTAHAPGLLAVYGLGPRTAALLLIAAGDHPGRLRSEAAWAHLCGVAPIPASSGKRNRHRHGPVRHHPAPADPRAGHPGRPLTRSESSPAAALEKRPGTRPASMSAGNTSNPYSSRITRNPGKGKTIDLWYSGKTHDFGGNIQALFYPSGIPLWISDVLPGNVHDLAAPRENVLGVLRPFCNAMPVLADPGYEGAGHGVHVPVKKPAGVKELDIDTPGTRQSRELKL